MYVYTSAALGQVHPNCVALKWIEVGQPCSISWKLYAGSLQRLMTFTYATQTSFFSIQPPITITHLFHGGTGLKNPLREKRAFAFIKFTNSPFVLLITVELVTFQILLQRPEISFSTRVVFTSVCDVLGRQVRSSTWMSVRPLSNSLHHCLSCYTLLIPPKYTSTNCQWISVLEKRFAHKHHITLQTSSRDRVCYVAATALQIRPWVTPDGLILESPAVCYRYHKCCFLPKHKVLGWHSSYRLGHLS
jgi:hypothetical protein